MLNKVYFNYYLRLTVDNDVTDGETSEGEQMDITNEMVSQEMPITIDQLYNLLVCNECGIGIPLERIEGHLKVFHGIKKKSRDIIVELGLDHEPMTIDEAKGWIQSVWVSRAIQGIPVLEGWKCIECQYAALTFKVMQNHFRKEHPIISSYNPAPRL
jgi:hypothetical protein